MRTATFSQHGAGTANNRVNVSVHPVTSLTNRASAALGRPAGYAERQADRLRDGRAYGREAFDFFYVASAADLARSLRIAE